MRIADDDVAAVRSAVDLVALVGEHVALRRQGRRWVGRCPFHNEKTPSFSLSAELGVYYCFGCQASGDAITFLRATEHLDFAEAVTRLAERAGVVLHQEDEVGAGRAHRRGLLLEAMEQAVAWYHDRLLSHPDAGPARDYLRSRGYEAEVVRQFRLGWAPDGWDTMSRALSLPGDVLGDTGLGFVNGMGRRQDVFRSRVLFPIFDPGGRPVAIGGRLLPGPGSAGAGPGPKYKNSSETPIYSKRRVLYGLNWAKADVVGTGEVIVCEGYTDVIALFGAGLPRAVATCGTALGEDHFKLLRNFAKRVVLAYDTDSAGQAAAERFYEWERRHELDIAVADMPAGTDPAELGRTAPQLLRRAVLGAKPFLAFRVGRILAAADLSTPEGRARAAELALGAVAEHPNQLVRDQYVMEVSGHCRMDAAHLLPVLARLRRRPPAPASAAPARTAPAVSRPADAPPRPAGPGPGPSAGPGPQPSVAGSVGPVRPGIEALRLAVHRPAEVAARLEATLFEDPTQRAAFVALASSSTLHEAIARAEPGPAALLSRLAVEESHADAEDVVRLLVRGAAQRAWVALEAEARGPGAVHSELAPRVAWLKLGIQSLDEPSTALEATDRLLAWLAEQAEEGR